MKVLFLVALLAAPVFAQPVYVKVGVDTKTLSYGSAKVYWTLLAASKSSIAYVEYGTNPKTLTFKSGNRSGGAGVERGAWLGGLQPNTRYYFRPVTADDQDRVNSLWGCTGPAAVSQGSLIDATCNAAGEPPYFTTPPQPSDLMLVPQKPTVQVDTRVPFATITYAVVRDCQQLQDTLNRAVSDSAFSVPAVDLAPELRCKNVTLPKKTTSNRILIRRVDAESVLPRPDTRIQGPGEPGAPQLPQFTTTGNDTYDSAAIKAYTSCSYTHVCTPEVKCGGPYCSRGWYFLGVDFTVDDPIPLKSVEPLPVTSIKVTTPGRLEIQTAVPHNLTAHDYILLDGITGFTASPIAGLFDANLYVKENRIMLDVPGVTAGSWTGSGRVYSYVAQRIDNITCGVSGNCIVDVGQGVGHGLQTGMIVTLNQVQGLSGLTGGSAKSGSYKIIRIDAQRFALSNTANRVSGMHVPRTGYYFIDHSMPGIGRFFADSADIVFDRCRIRTQFPRRATGLTLAGDYEAVVNSYIDIHAGIPIDPDTNIAAKQLRSVNQLTPVAVDIGIGMGKLISNNYLRSHGIIVFAPSPTETIATLKPATDITIKANTFHVSETFIANTAGAHLLGASPKLLYHHRHSVECKQCSRVLIDGNDFDGGYSGEQLNQPMLGFTPRNSGAQSPSTARNFISDLTITNNKFHAGVSVMSLTGSDWAAQTLPVMNTRRVLFENNLIFDMNWFDRRSSPWGPNAANIGYSNTPLGGVVFQLSHYPETVHIKSNTIVDSRGSAPVLMEVTHRVAGLVVENNIVTYNRGGSFYLIKGNAGSTGNFAPETVAPYPGIATVARLWEDTTQGTGRFQGNVLVRGTRDSSGRCHFDSSAPCNVSADECTSVLGVSRTFRATCFGSSATTVSRMDEVRFFDWTSTTKDLRLRSDSPFATPRRGADVEQVNLSSTSR